jgi:trans-aconitate 2-methyltransferase
MKMASALEHSSPPMDDVQRFYDAFLKERMLLYRVDGNLRIHKAIERVLPLVTRASHVLEIGCGIGLVAEAIARKARSGKVLAIDISEQNIWYARRTVRDPRASFHHLDALRQFNQLRALVQKPIDLLVLVDVIEHVPSHDRRALFEKMGELSAPDARLVLTYPSPQYQQYLARERPQELQIIDNVIELEELMSEASRGGFGLRHFSLENVWMTNQYVHCIFQKDDAIRSRAPGEGALPAGPRRLVRALLRRTVDPLARRYRRWKYVDRVFGCTDARPN